MEWINTDTQRWYAASVMRDLLDDTVIVLRWGSLVSRHGAVRTQLVSGRSQAQQVLEDLAKRRAARGYALTGVSTQPSATADGVVARAAWGR